MHQSCRISPLMLHRQDPQRPLGSAENDKLSSESHSGTRGPVPETAGLVLQTRETREAGWALDTSLSEALWSRGEF